MGGPQEQLGRRWMVRSLFCCTFVSLGTVHCHSILVLLAGPQFLLRIPMGVLNLPDLLAAWPRACQQFHRTNRRRSGLTFVGIQHAFGSDWFARTACGIRTFSNVVSA